MSKEEPMESQMARTVEALQKVRWVDYAVHTDGSAQGSTRDSGAEIVVMKNEELFNEWSVPAGSVTSTFKAESIVMLEATERLVGKDDWRTATAITDPCASWRAAHRPIYKEFHNPPTSTHLHNYTSIQQLRLVNIL